ncbi:MAG: hypothetical protein K6E95_05255 [Lachnospiraceae bacterium]|nr:hypothetical protein [Lachnospiraceae bacterium]
MKNNIRKVIAFVIFGLTFCLALGFASPDVEVYAKKKKDPTPAPVGVYA